MGSVLTEPPRIKVLCFSVTEQKQQNWEGFGGGEGACTPLTEFFGGGRHWIRTAICILSAYHIQRGTGSQDCHQHIPSLASYPGSFPLTALAKECGYQANSLPTKFHCWGNKTTPGLASIHCTAYFNFAGNINITLPHVIIADKVKVGTCRSGTQINGPKNIGSIHHAPCQEAKDFWMVWSLNVQ